MKAVAERPVAEEGISEHGRVLLAMVYGIGRAIKPEDPFFKSMLSVIAEEEPITRIEPQGEDMCVSHPGGRCTVVSNDGDIHRI